jgi:predicted transcriptional regulator
MPSPRRPPPIPRFEREIMEHVWRQGPTSVRAVMEAVNDDASRSPRAYTTVLTVMQRLETKGLLRRRRRRGRKFDVYAPILDRASYLRACADAEVDEMIANYGEIALIEFARRSAALDPERREELRRLAEQ